MVLAAVPGMAPVLGMVQAPAKELVTELVTETVWPMASWGTSIRLRMPR
jgi:hypothetical protein